MLKTVTCIALIGLSSAAYFNGKACWLNNDAFCGSCNYITKTCNQCSVRYTDTKVNNCAKPSLYIPYCATYATHNKCATCTTGFQVNKRNTCSVFTSSIAGCWQEVNGTCQYCEDARYFPDAQGNCGTQQCQIINCGGCTPSGTCGFCTNGFIMLNGSCLDANLIPGLANCAVATDTITCSVCNAGFTINNGACTRSGLSSLSSILLDQLRGLISSSPLLQASTR